MGWRQEVQTLSLVQIPQKISYKSTTASWKNMFNCEINLSDLIIMNTPLIS